MTTAAISKEKKLKILIVENNPQDAELCIYALKSGGLEAQVEVVENESDFRRYLSESSCDVILADYRLTQWTGIDALRLLKSLGRSIPFILVTATLGDEMAVECIKEGATDYVLKDQLARLPVAVRRALDEAASHRLRREALEELRRSEERYRLLFEHNPQPMWVYEILTLRFLAVNDAAIEHYGYSREEFLSMTITQIRPAEDVPALLESVHGASGPIDKAGVWRHRTKDGHVIFVEITECQLKFEGKDAALILANDVSERRRAEEALKKSEAEYRSIIEGALYGIFQVTADGKLLMANPAFVKLLGYAYEAEVLSLSANDVYWNSEERRSTAAHWSNLVAGHTAKWKQKDGSPIFVRLAGRLIPPESSSRAAVYEVFVEDITEHHKLEGQLRQAQKLEAVGRLAGGVAHDFNNLLMIIGSYAELIPKSVSDPAKLTRYTSQIAAAATRASDVTRQLLAFSRKQVLEPRVLDVNSLVTTFTKMLPRLLGEDVEMIVSPSSEVAKVKADPGQLEQVLMNLVINARDAMPQGGRLTIEIENVDLDGYISRRHGVEIPAGHYVMLAVSDTGAGMDAATKAQIFEPFFTTKERGKGTGLGLSTVYGIVKQSNGFIWVYSEPGRGSTFKVYLPRIVEPIPLSREIAPVAEQSAEGSETILLVEDEAALREVTREFLQSKGYKVLDAGDADAALVICQSYTEVIDLLITDMVLPGQGGPELASAINQLRPNLRVIYLSGYTDRTVNRSLMGPNAIFLQKPLSLAILTTKIRSVLSS